MKTLIVYSSKYGFTEECVTYLTERIKSDIIIMNVNDVDEMNLNDVDWVIMGGSVYMAKMSNKLTQFVNQNINKLLTKKLVLFVCCMTPEDSDKYIQACFPDEVFNAALIRTNFGGKLQQNKLNFLERTITKMVAKKEVKQEETLYENMDTLINYINNHS